MCSVGTIQDVTKSDKLSKALKKVLGDKRVCVQKARSTTPHSSFSTTPHSSTDGHSSHGWLAEAAFRQCVEFLAPHPSDPPRGC